MPFIGKVLLVIGIIVGISLALAAGVTVFVFQTLSEHGISPVTSYSDEFEYKYEETTERAIDAAGIEALEIDNPIGKISIRGTNTDQIGLQILKKASSEAALNEVEMEIDETGSKASVEVGKIQESNLFKWSVDLVITIPSHVALRVDHGAGDLRIEELTDTPSIKIDMGVGQLELVNITAQEVLVDAGAGEIFAQNLLADTVDLELGIGEIDFRTAMDSAYSASAEVGLGDLEIIGLDFPGVKIERHGFMSSAAKIELGTPERQLKLEVGMGSINFRVLKESD